MINLPVFLVALISGDRPDTFAGFFAGDLEQAHLSACRAYLGWRSYPFSGAFDLVLSASGGQPTDNNLVQAHKGLDNAFRLVKPGGIIVHLAACPDGLGGEGVAGWLPLMDLKQFERRLWDDYQVYGQTVYALKEKASRARILFVSSLDEELVRQLGMQPANDLGAALADVIPGLPANHRTAWFPDAASLLPVRKVKMTKRW
jgi:nickel-dependent lactate racemase